MIVAIYPESNGSTPYLRVLAPAIDDIETAAAKYLDPYGISYVLVDDSTIPPSPYFPNSQTVDISQQYPVFSWDLDEARSWATKYNARYWQQQYNQGILGLTIQNDYQLNLAIATPENERTADQVAAVEFLSGVNTLQQSVQDNIDAATNAEEIAEILSQLG